MRVLFLGPLRDLAPAPSIEAEAPLEWVGLLALVGAELGEQLEDERVHVACAGKVLADKRELLARDGDEVALLPPVSGG